MPVLVDIDAAALEGMALELERSRPEMERAVTVAARRTARWARAQITRGLASRLGVPQSVLAGKRLVVKSGRSSASVWIALNPLNLVAAGAVPSARGLRAGRQDFNGAFVMKGRYGRAAMRRQGTTRKPLESASLDVPGAAPAELNRAAWPALNERFLEFYAEELGRSGG